MKKIIISLLSAALFISCEKDEFKAVVQPVETGDEICFGTYLPQANDGTKTEYGEMVTTAAGKAFEVFWKTGDEISVCCPEAVYPSNPTAKQFEKIADYVITQNDTLGKQHIAKKVEKSQNDKLPFYNRVLQWSDSPTHTFYAVYPAKAIEKTDAYSFFYEVTQNQVVDEKDVIQKGNTYIIQPSMDNAIMYAYNKYEQRPADGMVELKFKPISTVLEITINGPTTENTQNFSISKVTVSSVPDVDGNRKAICGKYQVLFDKSSGAIEGTQPVDNGKASNTISVSTTRSRGIPLGKGEKAIYRVFLAPDLAASDTLSVSVSTPFGTLKKILDKTKIEAQKVNRVQLPEISRSGAKNNWISDLDPGIYITELSYPGSKLSVIDRFQNAPIKEQLKEGVRAFIIQSNIQTLNDVPQVVVASENGAVTNPATGTYVSVKDVVKPISDYLAANPKEFAIIMFTYCGTGSIATSEKNPNYNPRRPISTAPEYFNYNASQSWMRILARTCKEMAGTEQGIYHGYSAEVSNNTTVGDVAGHVVFKANYNDEQMAQESVNMAQQAPTPLLLSHWYNKYPQSDNKFKDGVPLYWSDTTRKVNMSWFYQEVTTVSDDGSQAEATYNDKVTYMKEMFEKSVVLYNDPTSLHDIWFVNDLGGRMIRAGLSDRKGEVILAGLLNPQATEILRDRKENASLGIIFMNFADRRSDSGVLYGSDWLIQTIIDNNFKFALRKAPGK